MQSPVVFSYVALILYSFFILKSNADTDVLQRIVNGTSAEQPLPYQVYLTSLKTDYKIGICGGIIISSRAVLTAAHCVDKVAKVQIAFGALNINVLESTRQLIDLPKKYIVIHEDYDAKQVLNDIAILKLPVDLQFNKHIQPVALPKGDITSNNFENRIALASGWGVTATGSGSAVLQKVDLKVISLKDCQKQLGAMKLLTPRNYLCAEANGRDTCQGDSGGPLVVNDGANTVTLIGITSFGYDCAAGIPSVYTRVSEYLKWIEENS